MANEPIISTDNEMIGELIPTGTLVAGVLTPSSGGGSVEKFVINFTNEDNTITSDKTIQEIVDAYNSGKIIEGLYMFGDMLAPVVLEPTFISYEENVYSAVQLLGIFDTGDEISSYAIVGLNDGTSDEWSVFAREIVNDDNYVHTDNNFTNADKNKLDGLENKIITVNANQQTMVLDKNADEIENYLNNGYIVMALGYQVFRRDYDASTHTIKLAIFFGSFGQIITVVGNQVTGVEEYFYVSDANYVHTDNNFTSSEKYKLESLGDYYVDLSSYNTGDYITDSDTVNKLRNERVVVSYNGTAYRFATTMGTGYIYTVMNSLTGGAYITLNYDSSNERFYFYEVGTAPWETPSNKVTSISSSSTDTQYPSAKCVYDMIGNVETILNTLNSGGGAS